MAKEQGIVAPFGVAPIFKGHVEGGLPTALMHTAQRQRESGSTLHVASYEDPLSLEEQRLLQEEFGIIHHGCEGEQPSFGHLVPGWFDEQWAYLHPEAYTTTGQPDDVIRAMYRGDYEAIPGTMEALVEHYDRYGPGAETDTALMKYAARMNTAVRQLPPNSNIFWQDYFLVDVMLHNAEEPKERGCKQTFHLHTTLPDELAATPFGEKLIHAMSKMDVVYVHTDEYRRRLERQLERAGLPAPRIERYDLGVDAPRLIQLAREIHPGNYREHPAYRDLTDEQRTLIDEAMRSRDTVPHRFSSIDRVDPIKGTHTVMEGVDAFLEGQGMSLEELREQYRFFFIMQKRGLNPENANQYSPSDMYTIYTNAIATELERKYPGVVFTSGEIPRDYIPAVITDTHSVTGGVQDGLCLAGMEGLVINGERRNARTAVIGRGTGFAIQTLETHPDGQQLAHFTNPRESEAFADTFRTIVTTANVNPGRLQEMTGRIVDEVISRRTDTVIPR